MCGIVGYLRLSGEPITQGENYLPEMCRSIHHRGPDDVGELLIGPAALGMTRLSIIDLHTGHQPISNEDGRIWIVFNGEIYNYKDLEKIVRKKGHTLKTTTDTEIIVHLYEEFGVDCLQYLEGMFAFAIWDSNEERLFIARDRMGEKPLHYGVFGGYLLFGSEIKGILAHPNSTKEICKEALQKYLAYEYVPAPLSMFEGVSKLLPAHFLLVQNGQIQAHRYWTPQINKSANRSELEYSEELTELLSNSTRRRLIASDVPVGVFLSGGIDSSTIAAIASRTLNEKLKTFSIGFSEDSFDESAHALAVAKHLGTEHHNETLTAAIARQNLDEMWDYLDEPLADAAVIPTFFLSKMTRQHVKVALAGEGGDELFGGYPTYQAHKLASIWNRIPALLRSGVLEPAIRSMPVSMNYLSLDYKAKRFVDSVSKLPVDRHLLWMGALPLVEQRKLVRSENLVLQSDREILPQLLSLSDGDLLQEDLLSRIMQLDMVTYLPDDLLVKADRSSMAASLEVRLPFLAHPLVEFALSLPSSYKVRGMTTKYLLKKVAAPLLPERILKRPKKGFGIPISRWMKHEFKPLLNELLSPSYIKKQEMFEWSYIEHLMLEHNSGEHDRRKQLWTLLMFQKWWQKFFEE